MDTIRGKKIMKLKFRILRLPTDTSRRPKLGRDNIPLLHPEGYLWFLWSGPTRDSHKLYILKKLA